MVQFSSIFTGFTKSIAIRNRKKSKHDVGREAMMLTSSSYVAGASENLAAAFSKGGKKGINQDRFIVWEDFGCQDDMIFCGVFDGHGPWGHLVAKRVRKLVPPALLRNWQKRVSHTMDGDGINGIDTSCLQFDIWKKCYFETCSIIDQELEQHADSFYSGTTALTLVRQGDLLVVANVGDSQAVLATTDIHGILVPVQLIVDLKPNLPRRVLSCENEPGVYRVWMPTVEGPGLAVSRAFGDYYIKDFGLISEPELTFKNITHRDHFAILATDGVWDVISNQEAVEIVCSTAEREEAAKRLVESAICAWKRKQRAICLFFHNIPPSKQEAKIV
ncbi:unnamed protein product [Withania somnifera]